MEPASLACSNRLGWVGGSSAYPVTLAPSTSSHIESQLPLKPVCPVSSTLRPRQNERLSIFGPTPPRCESEVVTERRDGGWHAEFSTERYDPHRTPPAGTCRTNHAAVLASEAGHRAFCSRQSASTWLAGGASTSLNEITSSFDISRSNTQPSERPIGKAVIARAAAALSMSP